MSAPQIKVKIQRRPVLKLKVLPKFPANVTAESPILLDRTGGNYEFSLDVDALTGSLDGLYLPAALADGSAATPSLYFAADTDSGLYRIGDNNVGIAVGGAKALDISSTGLGVVGTVLAGNGTNSLPAFGFTSDPDSGLYRIGADNIGVAVGGAKILDIASSLVTIAAAAALSILSTTDATSSTSTASLKTAGGVAIAKSAWIGTTLDVAGATNLHAALTYGGVALANSVTGTGSMVLSANQTLTGTLTAATIAASGVISTSNATSSTSTSTGAVTISAGGLGVSGNINYGGLLQNSATIVTSTGYQAAMINLGGTITGNNDRVSALYIGTVFNGSAAGGNNQVAALDINPIFGPSANVTTASGVVFQAAAQTAVGITIANLIGLNAGSVFIGNNGAVTNSETIRVQSPFPTGSLKPTTHYGMKVLNQGVSGITTSYALKIDAQSGSTTNRGLVADTEIVSINANGGIGYGTGAGDAQTQATSKSTTVVCNKPTGKITLNGAALAAATIVSFTLTNSAVAATDQINVTHESGGTLGSYTVNGRATGSGTAAIDVRNNTAGSLSEAIVLRFSIIKSVNA